MNENLKNKLEEAIMACATRASKSDVSSLHALQFTQAALNVTNALVVLECNNK